MIFNVYQSGFNPELPLSEVPVRPVDIDPIGAVSEHDLLERIFHNGQNDIQPLDGFYSVSVGDIIELSPDDLFTVEPVGFKRRNSFKGTPLIFRRK